MRRRMTEHLYNCRAHGTAGATGVVPFRSFLPGHYVAGTQWRPRHIHLRAQAPGHVTVVTQIYFHGDPYLGNADSACPVCKSGWPELLVPLELTGVRTSFSLADLENCAKAGATVDCVKTDAATSNNVPSCPAGQEPNAGKTACASCRANTVSAADDSAACTACGTETIANKEKTRCDAVKVTANGASAVGRPGFTRILLGYAAGLAGLAVTSAVFCV